MWRSGAPRSRPAEFVVITDVGPDPDDAKALLVLAIAHRQGRIRLSAVIANGGGQPARRAQLARLILDRVGEPAVPVGVGSVGVATAEQPHECDLRGFDAVDAARLLDGKVLLARTLARAAPRAITMLLISGLRDFADVVLAQPEQVLRKVRIVSIQGGLVPDAASPFGFAPDTSQNNAFDLAAADVVYGFCFAHGIRMSVVSRNAVPVRAARARAYARSAARAFFPANCAVALPASHPTLLRAPSPTRGARAAAADAARALVRSAHRVGDAALPCQRAVSWPRRPVAEAVHRPAARTVRQGVVLCDLLRHRRRRI